MSYNLSTTVQVPASSLRFALLTAEAGDLERTPDGNAYFVTGKQLRLIQEAAGKLNDQLLGDKNGFVALTYWEVNLLKVSWVLSEHAAKYIMDACDELDAQGLKGHERRKALRKKSRAYRAYAG